MAYLKPIALEFKEGIVPYLLRNYVAQFPNQYNGPRFSDQGSKKEREHGMMKKR